MRKTIVTTLLILFTASQAGYYCVYSFQQNEIKKQVKEQLKKLLPETSLQIIQAEENADAIIWQDDDKEFLLHGELYDVVKIKRVSGKTLLYCLNDKKEENLKHEFAKAIKSATDNNATNKSGKANYKFQLSEYYFYNNTEKLSAINFTSPSKYLIFISSLSSSVKEVNAPPPRA